MRFFLLLLLFLTSGCSQSFKGFMDDIDILRRPSPSELQVTFLGTSSFLITTPKSSVLIDGYISRESHNLWRRIEPSPYRISNVLEEIGIASRHLSSRENRRFEQNDRRQLDAIIPLHGHYDHAMDVGVIAGLTGATLYGDSSVRLILDRSKERFHWLPSLLSQDQFVPIMVSATKSQKIKIGDIKITLFDTPHSENLLSKSIEFFGDAKDWKFPARVANMKQGASMAAYVEVNNRAFLIFPTAGQLDGQVGNLKLTADTVFLGIGGLGWQKKATIKKYIAETVGISGAKTVYPIHWDDHQKPLNESLKVPFFEALDRVFSNIKEVSPARVRPIKAMQAFNPFD
ncbi:MAG: MBL fold metallo-hydrolase [Hyphomicrobiales bacterium]